MWPTTLEQPHFVSCAAATLMSLSLCLALPRTHLSLTHSHFWTLSLSLSVSHTRFHCCQFRLTPIWATSTTTTTTRTPCEMNFAAAAACDDVKWKSLPLGKSFNLGNGSTAELIDGSRIRIDIVLINVSINWVNLVSRAYVGYCMSVI